MRTRIFAQKLNPMPSLFNKLFYRQKPAKDRQYLGWDSVKTIVVLVSMQSQDIPDWLKAVMEAWRKAGKEVVVFNWIGKRKVLPGRDVCSFGNGHIRFNKLKKMDLRKRWTVESDLFIDLSDVNSHVLRKLITKTERRFSAGVNPHHRSLYELHIPLKNASLMDVFPMLESYLNVINKKQKTA